MIEMTGIQRRCKKILGHHREMRGFWKLKVETLCGESRF
jgi:hypothetical protein